MKNYAEKIIDVLNKDPHALKGLRIINEAAERIGLSPEEYRAMREFIILASMLKNEEARQIMSDEIWETLRKQQGLDGAE